MGRWWVTVSLAWVYSGDLLSNETWCTLTLGTLDDISLRTQTEVLVILELVQCSNQCVCNRVTDVFGCLGLTGSRTSLGVLVWVFIHLPNASSAILSPTLLRSALSLRIWPLVRVEWSIVIEVPSVDRWVVLVEFWEIGRASVYRAIG